ncbi:MAG: aa3-type cytochrome c oxidase subunit IV [Alphaproteobacteria bacterium]|nr:aa3-type cytochrome c oxidase subunit IV [Alphaproteobacteria bacterium]
MASKPTVMDHSVHMRGWQGFARFLAIVVVLIAITLALMATFLT